MIQEALFKQEAKWKLQFNKLHLKVDKSRDLYDFCVDLLKSGGIRFSEEVTTDSIEQVCTLACWIHPTRAAV
jgi:hypothetical protein